MSVSGKTAAPHEIPYFLDADKPPDMAAVTKAMANQTHARLDAIAPKQIVGPTKKQLLIANASGVVTAVTASGDVTNDESGVFTIGAEKVVTSKIANDAVTAAKIAAALKPSGTAAAGTEALRALGATASTACAGNDSRLWGAQTGEPSNTGGVPAASKYLPVNIGGVPYKVLLA